MQVTVGTFKLNNVFSRTSSHAGVFGTRSKPSNKADRERSPAREPRLPHCSGLIGRPPPWACAGSPGTRSKRQNKWIADLSDHALLFFEVQKV